MPLQSRPVHLAPVQPVLLAGQVHHTMRKVSQLQLLLLALVPSRDQQGSRTTQYSKGAHLTAGRENIRFLGELFCLLEQAGVELVLLYSLEAVEGLSEGGERDG